ncbi:hypothetical protein [Bacillus chungangensis]|uniref:Uncharacterized protein n=1 Tax=Bacillus chungangensis TaxID=587633 RepID=A0ABT9WS82_9BACI|nr:hypothetical protein [Bacillus chungangensis]MDQ0176141.1 hypothetical protein [Bacillus chungangensis]
MVWLFVILTVVVYSLLMKVVFNNILQPIKIEKKEQKHAIEEQNHRLVLLNQPR